MSVVDRLKNLFAAKKSTPPLDSSESVVMTQVTVNATEMETVQVEPPPPASLGTAAVKSQAEDPNSRAAGPINVPLLGTRPVVTHQRLLGAVLAIALLALAAMAFVSNSQSGAVTQQLAVTGQALVQAQRLTQAAGLAMTGKPAGFGQLSESAEALLQSTQALLNGDAASNGVPLQDSDKAQLDAAMPQVESLGKNAKALLAQQKAVIQAANAGRQIQTQALEISKTLDALENFKLNQGAALPEVAAVYQLKVLLLRIGKTSQEALAPEVPLPDAAQLGRDLGSFQTLAKALGAGNADLRIAAPREQAVLDLAETLQKQFEPTRVQAETIVESMTVLAKARQAYTAIIADSEPLRRQFEILQGTLSSQLGLDGIQTSLMLLAAAVAMFSAVGLAYVQVQIVRQRHVLADAQREVAQRMEQEAKRVNDANQAAILRLMNELQTVAEGDLTQEATVTEDITGAIADSVNYTVEELRTLVANVQNTASKVAQTTSEVDANSTELLAASNEQLHEIRETGRSVVDMAGRINEVSSQAQESARVARQSLEAAQSGLRAVQNTIGGMNAIRDQIQETSKRIKRLGESSQEIGEITELISDITEQTNVLALNAAIQAASAGDAGRGFSVVAEEVQRLAERSADATRQISALVKAIQTDTQDAIGAMERSTHGVVEGAKLTDNAGTALSEIDRVSRRVADLIEQISNSTAREASLANEVAENIQHIFAVTEQTGEGTRVTAGQVRELSQMAEELRQSVSRFKIN